MNSQSNSPFPLHSPNSVDEWLSELNSTSLSLPLVATLPRELPSRQSDHKSNPTEEISLTNPSLDLEVKGLLADNPSWVGMSSEALLWLRIGRIDRAHTIVQDASSSTQAYIHGVVHRLEGDYWNANYWFKRVRDQQLNQWITARVGTSISQLNSADRKQVLGVDGKFDPTCFVDAVESCCTQRKGDRKFLIQVGQAEWEALWEYVRSERT